MDRAVTLSMIFAIAFLGLWGMTTQVAVMFGVTFESLKWLLALSVAGAVVLTQVSKNTVPLCLACGDAAPFDAPRATLGWLLAAGSVAGGGLVLAWLTGQSVILFAAVMAVPLYGLWRGEGRAHGDRAAACATVPVAQIGGLILIAAIIAAVPLFLHRPSQDDANFLNLATGMMADPRAILTWDTMIGDPAQAINLPTYRVETLHALFATLAGLTGLEVIEIAHLVFPPAAGLFIVGAFTLFCRLCAGRVWLMALLIALTVLVLFDSHHRSYGNFAFTRLQHGKSLLFTGYVPLFYVFAARYWYGGRRLDWVLLVLLQAGACAASANAVFLGPLTIFVIATGLLIADRRDWGRYVALGLSCFWTVLLAMSLIFTTGVLPSEHTEPVLVLDSYLSTYGGALRALLIGTAVFTGWLLLDGPVRRLFLGCSLVYAALFLNPWLSPVLADHVTGNLNWRLYYALPAPLFVGVVLAVAVTRIKVPERLAIGASAVVLALAALSPTSTLSPQNEIIVDAFALDVPREDYAAARELSAYLAPDGTTLAPKALSVWLATLDDPPSLVAVRDIYLMHYRHNRSSDDLDLRGKAFELITDGGEERDVRDTLLRVLSEFDAANIIVATDHPNHDAILDEAKRAGFSEAHETARYELLKRSAPDG